MVSSRLAAAVRHCRKVRHRTAVANNKIPQGPQPAIQPNLGRIKIYSVIISGPGLKQDLGKKDIEKENAAACPQMAPIGCIQISLDSLLTSMKIKDARHLVAEHEIYGRLIRLRFRTEAQATRALAKMIGGEGFEGIIPKKGLLLKAQLCYCELHVASGMEKCMCSARRLKADTADLEDAFGTMKVEESLDTTMGIPKPASDIDGVLEMLQSLDARLGGDGGDSEML